MAQDTGVTRARGGVNPADHLALAYARAHRFAEAIPDAAERESAALYGLVKAAQSYDPARGAWPGYATQCIDNELRMCWRRQWRERQRVGPLPNADGSRYPVEDWSWGFAAEEAGWREVEARLAPQVAWAALYAALPPPGQALLRVLADDPDRSRAEVARCLGWSYTRTSYWWRYVRRAVRSAMDQAG
jgi:hypothetical protein